jgi:hypothetical protein
MRYSSEWRQTVERMGRWIDFDNDYKTLNLTFMESVWWAFQQLFEKGMVYRGLRVMPYSTGCTTPLSNFEAGQNYRDISDPAGLSSFFAIDHSTALLTHAVRSQSPSLSPLLTTPGRHYWRGRPRHGLCPLISRCASTPTTPTSKYTTRSAIETSSCTSDCSAHSIRTLKRPSSRSLPSFRDQI